MIGHHITSAWRSIQRDILTTTTRIVGLALGIAAVLVLGLYAVDEYSYDRFFENSDRIYRLNRDGIAWVVQPVAKTLKLRLPEVEAAARMTPALDSWVVSVPGTDRVFYERNLISVDPDFFRIFNFNVIAGDPIATMQRPDGAVLTRSAAEKYFGGENALGKTIVGEAGIEMEYKVGAVIEDLPARSHFKFQFVVSRARFDVFLGPHLNSWSANNTHAYLLLSEGADPGSVEAYLPVLFEEFAGSYPRRYRLQPLTSIHLDPLWGEASPQGSRRTANLFVLIAAAILLIGVINTVNLSTARSLQYAHEVGVRKVLGADRVSLANRFLSETAMITAIALLLALVTAELALPWVNAVTGKRLSLFVMNPLIVTGLLAGLWAVVTVLAGFYPAIALSSFSLASVFKSRTGKSGLEPRVRRYLVIAQFAVSAAMIAGTFGILYQLEYLNGKDLGFDRENVLTLSMRDKAAINHYREFRGDLLAIPGVLEVGAANVMPSFVINDRPFMPSEAEAPPPERVVESIPTWPYMWVDENYFRTLGIELVEGRGFDPQRPTDREAVIINQTGVRTANNLADDAWKASAAGHLLTFFDAGERGWTPGRELEVIGVVKDHHTRSLRTRIQPAVFFYDPESIQVVFVRLAPGDPKPIINRIHDVWSQYSSHPLKTAWLDHRLEELYRSERVVQQVFTIFAAVAILLASLGLFGLAAYSVDRRTKEIGIRKVLGASMTGIVRLISTEFLVTIVAANALALPAAAWALEVWLKDYAYRVELSVVPFALALAIVLLVTLLTISLHALRAARTDPVESLRYE